MKKISEHLGQIIVVLASIVLLVSVLATFSAPVSAFFGTITDTLVEKGSNMLNGITTPEAGENGSGSGGGSSEPQLGFPIEWNSMDVVGNTSFIFQEMPFVKVSEFTPAATELADSRMSAMGDTIPCDGTRDMGGFAFGVYASEIYVFSVTSAGEYADLEITFTEPGFYVLDFGSMGMDVDFVIALPMSPLNTPEVSLSGKVLTITPVENAVNYEVYIGDNLICTTTESSVDLSSELVDSYSGYVRVRAISSGDYANSAFSRVWFSLTELGPGLYDANGVLLSSWDQLVNDYGFDISMKSNDTPFGILTYNNPELEDGTMLIVSEDVVEIGSKAFSGVDTLEIVKFTKNSKLTNIGSRAFYQCSLTRMDIPATVTSIGTLAFDDIENLYLTDLTAWCHMSVAYNPGGYGYPSCKNLYLNGELITNLVISQGVTTIRDNAFYNFLGLTSVTIPDSVTNIGDEVFEGCTSLTRVKIGNCVTNIGDEAFKDCESLNNLEIGNKVATIGQDAFSNCKNLTSVFIPRSVSSFDNSPFDYCESLTSITVDPENTKYHSNSNCLIETSSKTLVSGCSSSIIPSDGSVTRIGTMAFLGHTELKSVNLPSCITYIGSSAFQNCTGLESITFDGTKEQYAAIQQPGNTFLSVAASGVVCSDGTWRF